MAKHLQSYKHFAPQLLKAPELVPPMVNYFWNRWYYAHMEGLFPRKFKNVQQISLKITNLCNLRCKMCGQWGESGYNLDKQANELNEVVDLETYKKMVDQVAHIKPNVYIWGGEPFLYKDLLELTDYIKQKKFLLSLVTNGVLLEKNAAEIVRQGWDILMLSLDGPREQHDEVRGVPGCFDTLMRGIEAVKRERIKQKKNKPFIQTLTTVNRDNVDYLEEIFDIAEEAKIDSMVVYYSWFTTQERGEAYEKIMKKQFDCKAEAWKGYLFPFEQVDTMKLRENVKKIKSKKYSFPTIFIPELDYEEIPKYFAEPGNFFGYHKCIAPWLTAEIMANGDVATCRDYPDYILGNIKNENLLDIFNNERAEKFRKHLREKGEMPICARCCGLMGL